MYKPYWILQRCACHLPDLRLHLAPVALCPRVLLLVLLKIPLKQHVTWKYRFPSWNVPFLMGGGIQWINYAFFHFLMDDPYGTSQECCCRIKLASVMYLYSPSLLPSFISFDPHFYLLGSNSPSKSYKPSPQALFSALRVDSSSDPRKQIPEQHFGADLSAGWVRIRTSMPVISGVVITSRRQWHYVD